MAGLNPQYLLGGDHVDEWERAFGFSMLDVDAGIQAGYRGGEVDVWTGRMTRDAVAAAVSTDPEWSDDLVAGPGYWCWTEHPDQPVLDRTSAARPVGQAGCLATPGSLVVRTGSEDLIRDVLLGTEGAVATLGDVEEVRLMVDAFAARGAYAAFATADVERYRTSDPEGPVLSRYEAIGLAAALDDDLAPLLVVAIVFADDSAATEGVADFREVVESGVSALGGRPWSDLVMIREVKANGRMVVAVLDAPAAASGLWIRVPSSRDSLIAWR